MVRHDCSSEVSPVFSAKWRLWDARVGPIKVRLARG